MGNNSHPILYFSFHSFISLGAATLHIVLSTNQCAMKQQFTSTRSKYTGHDSNFLNFSELLLSLQYTRFFFIRN